MELDNEVDYAMMAWARWMRDVELVAGYPYCDVSYKLSRSGYAGDGSGVSREMPEAPDEVRAADHVVARMPEELREFTKAWYGVDRFRPVLNPAQFNTHRSSLASRRRIVQGALKISRGTRSVWEKRTQELLNSGLGAMLRWI